MPERANQYRKRPVSAAAPRPTSAERGYGWRWQKARRAYLAANPLCRACGIKGRVTSAEVVDHVVPHKGNDTLFWDETNWQSLCVRCHNSKSARE